MDLTPSEASAIATDAWLFGMPLVYIDKQIDVTSHVTKPTGPFAPVNQFAHYREFPDASNRTIVGLNVDTLYSMASLDLAREPIVLSIPPMGERFWVMQMIDAWNNVPTAPGSREFGGKGGTFLIAGPGWTGKVPDGLTVLRMPTNLVMIGGRTYTASKQDYAAVHALQDQYKLVPLSAWGSSYTPPGDVPLKAGVDPKTGVPKQILAMSAETFFNRLNALMVTNPPEPSDPETMARIAKLGIAPGAKFKIGAFSPAVQTAINEGVTAAQKQIPTIKRGKNVNGWEITLDMGRYGKNYPYRAAWTFYGVGGNLAEDAVYPLAEKDGDGKPLDAANRYTLHFTRQQIPPVNAFWSLTLYDADAYLVPNPLKRSALGDRSGMKSGDDGSLTIYVQSESPGTDKEANWLPAPKEGKFKVALRLYGPRKQVTDGTWAPPGLQRTQRKEVPGPVPGSRLTEAYARLVARDAYFWAWPMMNIYNRRLAFKQAPEVGLMNGVVPYGPLNRLSMLHDYIDPAERWVACPNQDVVYGGAIAALDETPVVLQVPDFGTRFWVYQIVDLRTDSFADIGIMYGTKPGFYLLAGPQWTGEVPQGITQVFTAKTGTAFVVPRVFQDDTDQDKQAIQAFISGIDMYPLAEYDGKMKHRDWRKSPTLKSPTAEEGDGETKWVIPEKFFEELPLVLADASPLPGEESRYAEVLAVIAAAKQQPALLKAMIDEATRAEAELVDPLLQFRNYGIPLANNWTTITNGAAFGTDYFTRTAVAKSNILVNKQNETRYMYQDLDAAGVRLNGANRYVVTFPKGAVPPVKGFWSLTMYNDRHFFEPNPIKRYSVGTKNKDLKRDADETLTIHVQADPPTDAAQHANWLPAPKGDFSLYLRAYWPEPAITSGQWQPPAVQRQG